VQASPHGFFLDFTRIGMPHLVMHDAKPECAPAWHPVRGHPYIVTRTDTNTFLATLCAAFRRWHCLLSMICQFVEVLAQRARLPAKDSTQD
jgi:hypothetical protein